MVVIPVVAAADQYSRHLWRGTLKQEAPMSWEGPMELYIKYDPDESYPIKIFGVITWQSLSNARTLIEGEMLAEGKFTFHETKCVSGGCTQVVLGGNYTGQIKKNIMQGSGAGMGGLAGHFVLKAVPQEN